MGFVRFQSKHAGHDLLVSSSLLGSLLDDEDTSEYQVGDVVELTLPVVDLAWIQLLGITEDTQGVTHLDYLQATTEDDFKGLLVLEFIVVGRKHDLRRDWINPYGVGYRDGGTTVVLETLTDEAEMTFIFLEERFSEFQERDTQYERRLKRTRVGSVAPVQSSIARRAVLDLGKVPKRQAKSKESGIPQKKFPARRKPKPELPSSAMQRDPDGPSALRTSLQVNGIEPLGGYLLRVTWSDGSVRVMNLQNELAGPIFELLQDPELFAQVRVTGGTISWPNGADLAVEYLLTLPEVKRK